MIPKYSQFRGAIFDVDDTLLSNYPTPDGQNIHELSRLAAIHKVGHDKHIQSLIDVTPQENYESFMNAKTHSLAAALWNILYIKGLVDSEEVEQDNDLLIELAVVKNKLHERVLRTQGKEVPGATKFVRALAAAGLHNHLAIASNAVRRDLLVFLEMTSLEDLFPENRIISLEQLTHSKPHPEAFNLAFQSLNLPEANRPHVLAVEDDPRGIMSAKAAGLYTAAITTRYSREKLAALAVAPDLIAGSFAEFEQKFQLA